SWATEVIFPIEESNTVIRLQHILMMYFVDKDGSVSGPHVSKHWRQDWTYEDPLLLQYSNGSLWNVRRPSRLERKGRWSQAVYQVDDSPRYEALGKWKHRKGFSIWESEETARPLPRREYSVRSDYDHLLGRNRVTVLAHGWVHEEDNVKVTSGDAPKILAREFGLNRYDRLRDFNDAPARNYWKRTSPYWEVVRGVWDEVAREGSKVEIVPTVSGKSQFEYHFEFADAIQSGDMVSNRALREQAHKVVGQFARRVQ
ncbi:MAG: hypothetical protein KDD60_08625, partial [Bdellovibrionales bacterium]|nr:hypothetical protein [Bdellovibrionales bacterium]